MTVLPDWEQPDGSAAAAEPASATAHNPTVAAKTPTTRQLRTTSVLCAPRLSIRLTPIPNNGGPPGRLEREQT